MPFPSLASGRTFGRVVVEREVAGLLFSITAYGHGESVPGHSHREPYLCLSLKGEYEERSARASMVCPSGTVLIHPAGMAHSNTFGGEGGVCLNLFPSETWLQAHLNGFPPGRQVRRRSTRLEGLGRHLAIELRKEDQASSLAAESLALEILASVARSEPTREGGAPPWLARVVEWIDCELGSPLGLSTLAKVAEVSPSRLSRAFLERFGMNLGTYVRERRLARARDLVLRSRHSLVDIAVVTGFYDQSHFNKAFKSRYGCTPSALRE